MDEVTYSFLIIAPGPRPRYMSVAEHLWGKDCDFDSDGDSRSAGADDWTELTIALRPEEEERVDVYPADEGPPLILRVSSGQKALAEKAAKFIAGDRAVEVREEPPQRIPVWTDDRPPQV